MQQTASVTGRSRFAASLNLPLRIPAVDIYALGSQTRDSRMQEMNHEERTQNVVARETLVPWIVHLLALLEDLGVVPSVSKSFSVIPGIDAVYWVAHRSDQYQRKSV